MGFHLSRDSLAIRLHLEPRQRKKITRSGMTQSKEYRSLRITRLFLKMVGLWYVETARERLLLRLAFAYAVGAVLFAIFVMSLDLYHCAGDFYVSKDINE